MTNASHTASRVLIVDDELIQRKIVTQQLVQFGFICESAADAGEAMQILQLKEFDVVLLDVQMEGVSGLEVLPLIRKLEDAPEVVMLTLDNSLESGITAMREGAYDYLTKPAKPVELEIIINKATEKRRLVRQNTSLRDFVESRNLRGESEPLYESFQMREVYEQADSIARLNSTVLITGESGTGKDVLARYIHRRSARFKSAMVSVNCGAMPDTLFESEFFGFEKGSFTGANATKRGLLEAADGSTLFLDEIGEMPLNLQVKLLRFLENGEFRRVGGTRDLFADARLIAATNRDLTQAIRDERFRSDLYYRLNVIHLHIPPLRERREDIAVMLDFFLDFYRRQFNKPHLELDGEARRKLDNYAFPGNIRELKNIIERGAALSQNQIIGAENIFLSPTAENQAADKFDKVFSAVNSSLDLAVNSDQSVIKLDDLERHYILSILNHTHGNRERAAALLGISERTIYRRLREYE